MRQYLKLDTAALISPLLQTALDALHESTSLQGILTPDGQLTLRRGSRTQHYRPVLRPTFRPAHLPGLAEELHPHALLIARYISASLAQKLRERGIDFIDAAGNAHLSCEHWFVLVTGRSAPQPTRAPRRLSTGTWQVAYVLLRDPDASRLSVRALGERAGVSHGTASIALHALADRGWIRHLGRQGHPVTDGEGLLRAWELGYLDRLAIRLHTTQARPLGFPFIQDWGRRVVSLGDAEPTLLGGGLAAELLGMDLIASTAAVHVADWDATTMKRLRLAPAKTGPVTVLSTFGTDNAHPRSPHLADPLLIRAALMGISDERLDPVRAELLDLIRKRWQVA